MAALKRWPIVMLMMISTVIGALASSTAGAGSLPFVKFSPGRVLADENTVFVAEVFNPTNKIASAEWRMEGPPFNFSAGPFPVTIQPRSFTSTNFICPDTVSAFCHGVPVLKTRDRALIPSALYSPTSTNETELLSAGDWVMRGG